MPGTESQPRFGPIRATPPPLESRPGWSTAEWRSARLGGEGPYPNGGLWRFASRAGSMVVKRTGRAHLGGDPVWQLALDEQDPQWWGREAAFYGSELSVAGWSDRCRPVECLARDRRPGGVDLWLEDVEGIPLALARFPDAVRGLARWQARHRNSASVVLSRGWIAQHVARRRLDNEATLAHPGWTRLRDAGGGDAIRLWVERRVTTSDEAAAALAGFPQLPTHHDLHPMNVGADGAGVVIIDWATVGWGPVGHDAANLALDRATEGDLDVADLWHDLLDAYGRELRAAGVDIEQEVVERSAAVSATIRLGWVVDHLLELGRTHPVSELGGLLRVVDFLARLHLEHT